MFPRNTAKKRRAVKEAMLNECIADAQKADDLIVKHNTRNPLELLDELNITVVQRYMKKLKGCFMVLNRNANIILNNTLDEYEAV